MKPYPLLFKPVFKHRIWGGTRLRDWFHEFPDSQVDELGEAWILSDHGEGQSLIHNGSYAGKTLTDVIGAEPEWFPAGMKEFPLLFKVIDAEKDLSVQVHPDDRYGFQHAGERGKTECWWVLDATPGAKIVYGHRATTKRDFIEGVAAENWNELLQYKPVTKGQFWFIPAGKVHALGAGTLILEVQQSSDTTYRVYDYNRRDGKGNLRELHLEDAYNVISFPDKENPVSTSGSNFNVSDHTNGASGKAAIDNVHTVTRDTRMLAACPYFKVWSQTVSKPFDVNTKEVLVVCPTDGDVSMQTEDGENFSLPRGHAALLPQGLKVSITTRTTPATLLWTAIPPVSPQSNS